MKIYFLKSKIILKSKFKQFKIIIYSFINNIKQAIKFYIILGRNKELFDDKKKMKIWRIKSKNKKVKKFKLKK